MFVWEKLKHFGNSLNSFRNELDPAKHTKERPWREMNFKELQEYRQENRHKGKFAVVLFATRIKESSNRKSLWIIDHLVFNNLVVDNAGQLADNKHTG